MIEDVYSCQLLAILCVILLLFVHAFNVYLLPRLLHISSLNNQAYNGKEKHTKM